MDHSQTSPSAFRAEFTYTDPILSDFEALYGKKGTVSLPARILCGVLGIEAKETAALGDNFNDLPLLEAAGRAYVMETAPQAMLDRFPLHCRRAEDTLRLLLEECGG